MKNLSVKNAVAGALVLLLCCGTAGAKWTDPQGTPDGAAVTPGAVFSPPVSDSLDLYYAPTVESIWRPISGPTAVCRYRTVQRCHEDGCRTKRTQVCHGE